jgi:hypothetical protein
MVRAYLMQRVGLALLLLVVAPVAGCGSLDPTDPSNFNNVTVKNDTGERVILIQCDTTCKTLHDRTTLEPGNVTVISVSNENISVGYVVAKPSGQRLGCLYFRYSKPQKNLHAMTSEVVRCST